LFAKDSEVVIRAKNLTKKYKDFVAVDGIDFEVKRGESFGLLGPNGAGKSTTMKMISSVSQRTGGELTILGFKGMERDLGVAERSHAQCGLHGLGTLVFFRTIKACSCQGFRLVVYSQETETYWHL